MALSEDSTRIVDALWNHITELHAEWKIVTELFGGGQEQADLINATAGGFFDTVYRTLMRDILLEVSRLTDPLATAGKDKLVLERLALLPEVQAVDGLAARVSAKLADVKSQAASIRDYRNKYLAHLDLAVTIGPSSDVLPSITRQDIDGVLAAVSDLFNLIEQPLRDSTVLFKEVSIHGGPRALLKRLDEARSWRSLPFEERERWRQQQESSRRDA